MNTLNRTLLATVFSVAAPLLMNNAATAADPATPASSNQHVVGFGKDVAISTALRDIVPSDRVVRFAPGASPRARTNWSGGQDWETTARNAAKEAGLRMETSGNTITFVPAAGSPPSNTSAAPSTAPAMTPPVRHTDARMPRKPARAATQTPDGGRMVPYGGTRYDSPTIDGGVPHAAIRAPVEVAEANRSAYDRNVGVPPINNAAQPSEASASMRPGSIPVGYNTDPVPARRDQFTPRGYADPVVSANGPWTVTDHETLLEILQRWCRQAGDNWRVDGSQTPLTFRPSVNIEFRSDLPHAVESLINAIHAPVAPYASVHIASRNIILVDAEHNSISATP